MSISLGPVERRLHERVKKGAICAALIDPEDFTPEEAGRTSAGAIKAGVSLVMVGGSTVANQTRLDSVVRSIKRNVTCDVILFPGNITGVSKYADAILFSSLLNSTNPYFIIGAQALGAPEVYKAGIESIPMGYLVFGNSSATSFIGQVNSLPYSKPNLAVIYSLAAKYLGIRSLYLEAGSGADKPMPEAVIAAVRKHYDGLLIVGGGITSPESARKVAKAGADILVVGNLLQRSGHQKALTQITVAVHSAR